MRVAFKEWAIVVDALGRGEQILILRKGGLSEGREGFRVEHPDFLLFPTLYHHQRESVLPEAQLRFDQIAPHWPPLGIVRLAYFASVADWQRIDSLSVAERLRGQHCWRDEVIANRFDWGRSKNIIALALRVFRLAHEIELAVQPAYGGCKSWVELECDIPVQGAQPVLDEQTFHRKLRLFHAALNPILSPAAGT